MISGTTKTIIYNERKGYKVVQLDRTGFDRSFRLIRIEGNRILERFKSLTEAVEYISTRPITKVV